MKALYNNIVCKIFIFFCVTYTICSILNINITINPVHADVAGMDSFDLEHDYDFEQAVNSIIDDKLDSRNFEDKVKDIIENCKFHNNSIDC